MHRSSQHTGINNRLTIRLFCLVTALAANFSSYRTHHREHRVVLIGYCAVFKKTHICDVCYVTCTWFIKTSLRLLNYIQKKYIFLVGWKFSYGRGISGDFKADSLRRKDLEEIHHHHCDVLYEMAKSFMYLSQSALFHNFMMEIIVANNKPICHKTWLQLC